MRRALRSTTARAVRLTMIVSTNSTTPRPISADAEHTRGLAELVAMTAGME